MTISEDITEEVIYKEKRLLMFFYNAHEYVVQLGYEYEIDWCRNTSLNNITAAGFFSEYVWCVLNAGMKEQVASRIYSRYMNSLDISIIRHKGKREAIKHVFDNRNMYFDKFVKSDNKVEFLKTLPWIGDVTKYHLARNLGVDVVKSDRHLVRLAKHFGYETPLDMCNVIQNETDERLGIIDLILWRYCNLRGGDIEW